MGWPILLAMIVGIPLAARQYFDLEEGSNAIKYTGQSVFSAQRHPSATRCQAMRTGSKQPCPPFHYMVGREVAFETTYIE